MERLPSTGLTSVAQESGAPERRVLEALLDELAALGHRVGLGGPSADARALVARTRLAHRPVRTEVGPAQDGPAELERAFVLDRARAVVEPPRAFLEAAL